MLSLKNGASGIFLAILAGDLPIGGQDHFEEFILPPALKVLNGIKGLGKLNTLHLCGAKIYTDHISEYPVPVLNWADRSPDNPSLEEMRDMFDGTLMGGIDHTMLNRKTWETVKKNVLLGIKPGRDRRFILANGCSSPTTMNARIYERMVDLIKSQGINM